MTVCVFGGVLGCRDAIQVDTAKTEEALGKWFLGM